MYSYKYPQDEERHAPSSESEHDFVPLLATAVSN
jgi:hypothetical protein